jgi:hypothetical protein
VQIINTFCTYHLGDNLVHINFMRRAVARNPWDFQFVHAVSEPYLPQLRETVADLPTVKLIGLSEKPDNAIDVWKNRNADFYGNPLRDDWAAYHVEFFDKLATEIGVKNPLRGPYDFLFDYPACGPIANDYVQFEPFDFLIVNSQPLSSQANVRASDYWPLVEKLLLKGYSVVTTEPTPLGNPTTRPRTISGIGQMAHSAKYILGVVTGPMWPTLSIWNTPELRVHILERERVEIAANTEHATGVERATGILIEHGLL